MKYGNEGGMGWDAASPVSTRSAQTAGLGAPTQAGREQITDCGGQDPFALIGRRKENPVYVAAFGSRPTCRFHKQLLSLVRNPPVRGLVRGEYEASASALISIIPTRSYS
jgi:hypothetical protein